MVVDVRAVDMRGNRKGMVPLGEPRGKLVSDRIGLFRSDLSRAKRLSDLIGDDVAPVLAAGDPLIFPF